MKYPLTALAGLLLACCVQAQDQLAQSGAQILRLDTNAQGEAQGLFQLQGPIHPKSQPSQSFSATGAEPLEALAQAFFQENESLFGAPATALMLHKRSQDRFGGQHLRYYRTLAGIPVKDMEVLVHFNTQGEISSVNGEIVQISDTLTEHMRTKPVHLSQLEALSAVAKSRAIGINQLRLLNADLWLFNDAPHIRWHLDLNPENAIDRLSYWLDAETGEVLEVQNTLRHPMPFGR